MAGWCYCLEAFRDGEFGGAANVGVVSCSRLRKLAPARGKTAGLRYHASIPLEVMDGDGGLKRLGMLNVAGPEWRELDGGTLSLLRTLGDMLGVAVERARLDARRLESAQTEERNRLAREIHDTLAQDLSAVIFQLEAAEALLVQRADPARVQRSVTAALDLARKGLDEARRSVLDLRAAPLEGRTLPVALATLAEETDTGNGPAVLFEMSPAPPPLPPAVEVGLYRIAQEALQNALRHADASRVVLRLEAPPGRVRLTVQDDGRGFDASGENAAGHFGLVGMRERARLLGGGFQIESSSGAGTRITADIPLSISRS
jgi:two-component system NarL family sensor kinase